MSRNRIIHIDESLDRVLWNALGEPVDDVPGEIAATSEELKNHRDCRQLCYGVQLKDGRRGVLLLEEWPHSKCDDEMDNPDLLSEVSCWESLLEYAHQIVDETIYEILIGRETGPCGRHEIGVFIPFVNCKRDLDSAVRYLL